MVSNAKDLECENDLRMIKRHQKYILSGLQPNWKYNLPLNILSVHDALILIEQ